MFDVDTVEPTLTIDKDVSGQVGDSDRRRAQPGDASTYSLLITNTGSGAADDITVADEITAADPTDCPGLQLHRRSCRRSRAHRRLPVAHRRHA